MDFNIVMLLAFFTLGAGILIGFISLSRAKKAQDSHEGAAAEGRNPFRSTEPVPPEMGQNPPAPIAPRE